MSRPRHVVKVEMKEKALLALYRSLDSASRTVVDIAISRQWISGHLNDGELSRQLKALRSDHMPGSLLAYFCNIARYPNGAKDGAR